MKYQSSMWAASLFLTLMTALCPAQLVGSFTIDSSLPTGGTNFATFVDAAAALVATGVSGPVMFTVTPGGIPYAGFSIATPIPGGGVTNPIVFTAPIGAVISGPAVGYTQTIHLGTNTTVVGGGPTDITFENLEITGSAAGAAVMVSGCTNITFRNCRAHTCGNGIYMMQSTGCVVEDCEVDNVGSICGTPGSTAYIGCITSYYNNNNFTVRRNRAHDSNTCGIFIGTSGNTTMPLNNIVVNNFVWAVTGTASSYPGGIAIRRTLGSVFANNSVWMPAGSANAGINQMATGAGVSPASIVNNIVKHDGTGACFRFESSGVFPATLMDNNLYDPAASATVGAIAAVPVTSLVAWQATAAPNLALLERFTLVGSAAFLSAVDLHITPSSLAFNAGQVVAQAMDDIDAQLRPIAGVVDIGADETVSMGLFASFTNAVSQGPSPLMVGFTDNSFTSSPGGITSWAWDFQNDGVVDSTVQNPTFPYTCPGVYSVRLTVGDGVFPNAMVVRMNLITVVGGQLSAVSSGLGVGDLTVTPVPVACYPNAVQGWTLASLSGGMSAAGSGPFLGLYPDAITIDFILQPALVGNPLHFVVAPGFYPDSGPLVLPPGTVAGLSGVNLDLVQVVFDASFNLVLLTNVARATL